ncbi:MAG: ABC transporter ATP-binding protein [Phycisphaerales bacterium]|nr:ABC transporter ATP-binding protein [Phycisphaerales bacterium]
MFALEITNLVKDFVSPDGGALRVIDVPRLVMQHGEQVALRGASGSGKTTLLQLIAGIIEPSSGSVSLVGQRMSGRPESTRDRLRAEFIGYVFQSFHLLPGLTALENVELPLRLAGRRDRAFAVHLLDRVGMSDRRDFRPRQLSVGQQQRVALARALSNRPALVIADEPTGNLDRRRADEAAALLREMCQENNAALLLVTHDTHIVDLFERSMSLDEVNIASTSEQRVTTSGERL